MLLIQLYTILNCSFLISVEREEREMMDDACDDGFYDGKRDRLEVQRFLCTEMLQAREIEEKRDCNPEFYVGG